MCGIAGFIGNLANGRERVRGIIRAMAYRGPDDAGFYDADGVQLGMCRLSIVDTVGGGQPLYNEDYSVVVVCNGEIYNHRELRRMLEAKGHRFRTGSDCETIVHLYEEKGDDCIYDLHGMFAFLLWDERRKRLLAARDRVGIKPLYYHVSPEGAYFCSEFSRLAQALGFTPDLPTRAVWSYLCFGFPVISHATLDSRIQRLAPGEVMSIEDRKVLVRRYWRPKYLDAPGSTGSCNLETIRGLFLEVLQSHLDCEVPSALMLSGGLDSSCLAAYAGQLGYKPLIISAGYDGEHDCDERKIARDTARRLGFDMEEVVLDGHDYLQAFDQLMRHCDEPVADIAIVPQWQIYKRVQDMGIKVLHSGLGGDEIFFGYGLWNDLGANYRKGIFPRHFESDDVSGFYFLPCFQMSRGFLELNTPAELSAQCCTIDGDMAKDHALEMLRGPDRIYHLLFETWLPNNCLHLADRLSMGNSVEIRVPLLDDRFVDYVQGLFISERFQDGANKPLLKRMLSEHFDRSFLDRPKRGFTPPSDCYESLLEKHKEVILDGHLASHFFSCDSLSEMWKKRNFPEIWFRILTFEKWLGNLLG